jgi:hypothetical protein
MLAIPYFIHNKDKKPIADTLANDVALGLTQSGYRATSVANPSIESPQSALSAARQSSPSRILLVRMNKFESDSQIRTEFGYDLIFEVCDAKGRLLASANWYGVPVRFSIEVSGGLMSLCFRAHSWQKYWLIVRYRMRVATANAV